MDRLEELQKEREKLRERLSEIREEELSLELEGLNLQGKYLYCKHRDLYIDVSNFWFSESDQAIILEGETLEYSTDEKCSDLCYFYWNMWDQVKEPFTHGKSWFKENWKEITEDEWLNVKNKALETFIKDYK